VRALLIQMAVGLISSSSTNPRSHLAAEFNLAISKAKKTARTPRARIDSVDEEKPYHPGVMLTVDHPRCHGERIVLPVFLGY